MKICIRTDNVFFSKIIPSFFTIKEGSTSLTKPLSCPKIEDVTALLGAQNRFAIRMADHQRSTPCCAGWDRRGKRVYNLQLIVCYLYLGDLAVIG